MTDGFLRAVLLANLASSLLMTGLIWFVQIVHYPLFAKVGAKEFAVYQRKHSELTSFVVGPLMLIEAACAVALLFPGGSRLPSAAVWTAAALLLVIWLSTAALQVPCHTRLEAGFEASVHRRLVRSNWIRTCCWTLRSWIAFLLVWRSTSR